MKRLKYFLKDHPYKVPAYIALGLFLVFFINSIFLGVVIIKFNGIETILRGISLTSIFLVLLIFYFWVSSVILKKKMGKFILFYLAIIPFIFGFVFVSLNLNRLYAGIDTISKEKVIFSSSLIALESSGINDLKDIVDLKIGILKDTKSTAGYIIPKEIIKENNLEDNNEIIEYSDFVYMLNDLYDKKIDLIFLDGNYISLYTGIERFINIEEDTTVIISKEKEGIKESIKSSNKDITEPFTMLIMGVDSKYEGIENATAFNGDALMLLTFNPDTLNATIVSIPRDTYVPITCFKDRYENKITHAAWQGEKCMMDTIQAFTGIEIDYYLKVNFKGVVELVESLKGITVDVPIKFCEQDSNRSWGNNTICLNPGIQELNGEQALALSRHRKTIDDFVRGQNQQLVIKGILNKSKTIKDMESMYNLLDTVSDNIDTNLSTNQLLSFYGILKDIVLSEKNDADEALTLERLYLSGYSRLIWDKYFGAKLYNFIYYDGSLDDVVNAMKTNLGIKKPTILKEFSFSINDPYVEIIVGQGSYNQKNYITITPSFIGEDPTVAEEWAAKYNIEVIINEIEDELIPDGKIVSQSIPHGFRVDKINGNLEINISINTGINEGIEEIIDCEEDIENTRCFVPDFIGKNISYFDSWRSKLPVDIICTTTEVSSADDDYDALRAGMITEQSIDEGMSLLEISSIEITYMEASIEEEPITEDPAEEDPPEEEPVVEDPVEETPEEEPIVEDPVEEDPSS